MVRPSHDRVTEPVIVLLPPDVLIRAYPHEPLWLTARADCQFVVPRRTA
jgi:hypothetical protein